MVGIGSGFFVQIPNKSGHRILHPAKVCSLVNDVFNAELEERDIEFIGGQGILVYYEKNGDFLQQPACIHTVDETDGGVTISFETQGEAVSAESRQCYRVSTVMTGMTASLDHEKNCPLLDVSATGFSVIAASTHSIGDLVDAELELEGQRYSGQMAVQSVRELSKGRIRYGTHCADTGHASESVKNGLTRISTFVQRLQLKRMSGAV